MIIWKSLKSHFQTFNKFREPKDSAMNWKRSRDQYSIRYRDSYRDRFETETGSLGFGFSLGKKSRPVSKSRFGLVKFSRLIWSSFPFRYIRFSNTPTQYGCFQADGISFNFYSWRHALDGRVFRFRRSNEHTGSLCLSQCKVVLCRTGKINYVRTFTV